MRTRVLATVLVSGMALAVGGCSSGASSSGGGLSHFDHRDQRGDVHDARSGATVAQSTDVDLTGTMVRRTEHALRMVLSYARLDPQADARSEVTFKLKRPGRRGLLVTWTDTSHPGPGPARTVAHIGVTRITATGDVARSCPSLSAVPDDRAGTLSIRVPGHCFGNPSWVRVVGLEASTRARGADDVDDALTSSGTQPGRTPKLVLPKA